MSLRTTNTTNTTRPRALRAAATVAVLGAMLVGPAALPAAAASPGAPAHGRLADLSAHPARAVVPVRGTIVAVPELGTLTVTPSHGGARCLFRLESTLELEGVVAGTATGVTQATIHAPCAEATSNPPGTFADTFAFTGGFTGTVAGDAAAAEVTYAGVTRAGGEVSALLLLDGDATVVATVNAGVDVAGDFSGTYRGISARAARS
jgi:hypothetical protein